jgi:hypothetical protein
MCWQSLDCNGIFLASLGQEAETGAYSASLYLVMSLQMAKY